MSNKNIIIIGNGSIANKYKKILSLKFKKNYNYIIPARKFLIKNKLNTIYLEIFKNHKFDLAIICSPANMHIDHALFFARKGVNLLIEKPLSSSISHKIFLLKNIINKKKLLCHVGYMFKLSSAAQKVKKLIMNREIGDIKNAEIVCKSFLPMWRKKDYKYSVSAKKKLGGGVINELSHEIHLLLWFFGFPAKVHSYNFNSGILKIDCEDNSISNFKYSRNFNVTMNLSFSKKIYERFVTIIGSKGNIIWNNILNKIEIKKKRKLKIIKYKKENLYLKQLELILKKKKISVPIQEGIDVLKVINKMKYNKIK